MDTRLALVALWIVAAGASVAVGFAAAGLVGDPFSDGTTKVVSAHGETPASTSLTEPSPARPTSVPTRTRSAPATKKPGPASTRSAAPARPAATSAPATSTRPSSPRSSARSTAPSARSSAPAPAPATRGISTRGGYVSGTCRGGLVSLSASPAVGWRIAEIDGGRSTDAAVHFRQSGGEGEVEVHASCVGGSPQFSVGDHGGGGRDGQSVTSGGDE